MNNRPKRVARAQTKGAMGAIGSLLLLSCSTGPHLPENLNGKGVIVLGFTAEESTPYEGGVLSTGLRIESVDGKTVNLQKFDYVLVEPGQHQIKGHCYWRVRGINQLVDDLYEPAQLTVQVEANTRYTIQSEIDEYKTKCKLRVIETPHG